MHSLYYTSSIECRQNAFVDEEVHVRVALEDEFARGDQYQGTSDLRWNDRLLQEGLQT